jgi:hypothetical protein
MKKNLLLTTAFALFMLFNQGATRAQSPADELPKFEVGAQFSSLTYSDARTEPGLGARLTYNVNSYFALEAEGNFFPHNARFRGRNGGRAAQGLFGVKLGKRYEKFGFFGKVRPGFISFTEGKTEFIPTGGSGFFPFNTRTERLTHFATDVGAVIEFYPSRRIVVRFDGGDTVIRYGETTINSFTFLPDSNTYVPALVTIHSDTTHNFQFSAGVGFRF